MPSEENNTRGQCHGCAYRSKVPGDAHSTCNFDFRKAGLKMPAGDPNGVRNGWYMFPVNYDPNWMVEACGGRSETKDPEMIRKSNPLLDILSMLR